MIRQSALAYAGVLMRGSHVNSKGVLLFLAAMAACQSSNDGLGGGAGGGGGAATTNGGMGGTRNGGEGGHMASGGEGNAAGAGGNAAGAGGNAAGTGGNAAGTGGNAAGTGGNAGSEGGSAGSGGQNVAGAGGAMGGTSSCLSGNYLFCEGFEGATINNTVWNVEAKGAATISIDKTERARGGSSLHVTVPASNADKNAEGARVVQKTKIAALQNHYFARFFIKLPKSIPKEAHSWFFSDESTQLGMQGLAWRMFMFSKEGKEDAKSPDAFLVQERWVCLEWEVDAQKNVARLWVDDSMQPDYTMNLQEGWLDALDYPKHFGFDVCCDFDKGWAATEVWLDELVMDSKRIHCM